MRSDQCSSFGKSKSRPKVLPKLLISKISSENESIHSNLKEKQNNLNTPEKDIRWKAQSFSKMNFGGRSIMKKRTEPQVLKLRLDLENRSQFFEANTRSILYRQHSNEEYSQQLKGMLVLNENITLDQFQVTTSIHNFNSLLKFILQVYSKYHNNYHSYSDFFKAFNEIEFQNIKEKTYFRKHMQDIGINVNLEDQCEELSKKLLIIQKEYKSYEDFEKRQKNKIAKIIDEEQKCNIKLFKTLKCLKEAEQKFDEVTHKKSMIQEKLQKLKNYVYTQTNKQLITEVNEYKSSQYELVDYAHQLGFNCLQYDQSYSDDELNCLNQEIKKEISSVVHKAFHTDILTQVQKQSCFNAFLTKVHEEYQKEILKIQKLLDKKTSIIIEFTKTMEKWAKNIVWKKQYFSSFLEEFVCLDIEIANIFEQGTIQGMFQQNKNEDVDNLKQMEKLKPLIEKLKENFMMISIFI